MAGTQGGDLHRLKERAARAMMEGGWRRALELLRSALELAPADTHVALKIADMHQRLGERGEAIEAYKQAAAMFAAAGFLVKAISIHKIILSLDPSDVEVEQQLAALYATQRSEVALSGSDDDAQPAGRGFGACELPPELLAVRRERLPRTPLLSDLTELELLAFIGKLATVTAAAGTLICRDGESADSMFIIAHGLVRISSRDEEGRPLWLTNLGEGEFFGEFGLLGDGRRHADVEAVEDTELLRIGRVELDELVALHPRIGEVLVRFYKERVVDTLLAKSPLFRTLEPEVRAELIGLAAIAIHEAGSMIIQEGDDGEHLYVVKSGTVEVYTGLADRRIDLAVLRPGDIFGEISLLTGTPTTACVVALERVELVVFSRREVIELARQHPSLAHQLSATKEYRVHDTVQRLQTEGFV